MSRPSFSNWFNTEYSKGDRLAEEVFWNLTNGVNFDLPPINWNDLKVPDELLKIIQSPPKIITIEDLTERKPGGNGAFDAIMESFSNHLKQELEQGRMSGAEYNNAYVQSMGVAIQQGLQFVLNQEQIKWSAINAQLAAIKTLVDIAIAKANLVASQMQANTARAEYAVTKSKLSTEMESSKKIREEMEATRGQTSEDRTDSNKIEGLIGKQKELYSTQIESFIRNNELKLAKMYVDGYTINKTVDEGVLPPASFQNNEVDAVLRSVKSNVGL